ncbi:MAG: arginine repressor [Ruminococcaceae bacterium]|nr:arginine repressor [Oscillospiraceae bacterium]
MKRKRQQKILELITNNIVLTQDDLQNLLLNEGFEVTQSTVSRDIKELRLIKGHDSSGNYRYVSSELRDTNKQAFSHFRDIFSRYTKSVDFSLNDVVIKCVSGMASSVCVALDAMYSDMMLGTIAGDDTVFVVTRSEAQAAQLTNELKKMM